MSKKEVSSSSPAPPSCKDQAKDLLQPPLPDAAGKAEHNDKDGSGGDLGTSSPSSGSPQPNVPSPTATVPTLAADEISDNLRKMASGIPTATAAETEAGEIPEEIPSKIHGPELETLNLCSSYFFSFVRLPDRPGHNFGALKSVARRFRTT